MKGLGKVYITEKREDMGDEVREAYCEICHKKAPFEIRVHSCRCKIKGVEVSYDEMTAYCIDCGSEVWVGEVEDYNVRAARKAYCEYEHLITPEKIGELLKKYGIGAKPLSLLLGWGEVTITRFYNGAIPSVMYSNALLNLLSDEEAFYRLVESNKEKIKPSAYSRLMAKKPYSGDSTLESEKIVCVGFYSGGESNENVISAEGSAETRYEKRTGSDVFCNPLGRTNHEYLRVSSKDGDNGLDWELDWAV